MYYICLIVPMFVDSPEEEEKRKWDFREWSKQSLKPKLKRILGDSQYKIELLLGFTGGEDTIGNLVIEYQGRTPKGLLVRGKLLSITNKLDIAEREEGFVVLVDGSGKIDYDCILDIIEALTGGENIVLGCRHKDSFGIKDERKNIELFENFLVSEKFKIMLPDAQCGCWGFRANLLKKLPLTANSYEIELDLLISALDSRLDVCFLPVNIIEEATKVTSFTPEQHINKLNFLLNKLSFDEFILKGMYEKFKIEKELFLPESYVSMFKTISLSYHKHNPRCYSGCTKPCTKTISPLIAGVSPTN